MPQLVIVAVDQAVTEIHFASKLGVHLSIMLVEINKQVKIMLFIRVTSGVFYKSVAGHPTSIELAISYRQLQYLLGTIMKSWSFVIRHRTIKVLISQI